MQKLAILLSSVTVLAAQVAPSPKWKEFSLGPPTRNQMGFNATGIRAQGVPLVRAVARAYGLPEHRVVGPEWIHSERYAIVAQVEDPSDFQPLFQQELAAQFQMVAHLETREVPVYTLRLLPGGPPPAANHGKGTPIQPGMSMTNTTATAFANALADYIERPVFDVTGLTATLDFSLHWAGDWTALEAAAREQLGMELAPGKRRLELLVIEKIERPKFPK